MKLFVKCQRYGSNSYVEYEGQSQDTVTTLLMDIGATNIQFLSQDEWLAANPPRVL